MNCWYFSKNRKKGSKKMKSTLKETKPNDYSYFEKIWDLRNRHMVKGLPEQYVFFLLHCYETDCVHPVCQRGRPDVEMTWWSIIAWNTFPYSRSCSTLGRGMWQVYFWLLWGFLTTQGVCWTHSSAFAQRCVFGIFQVLPRGRSTKMRFWHKKLPRIAGNLLHLVGTPGLMPRYSPGMGVRGFPLTSAWRLS